MYYLGIGLPIRPVLVLPVLNSTDDLYAVENINVDKKSIVFGILKKI